MDRQMEKFDQILTFIDKLPSLPTIYTKLSHLLHSSNTTMQMIGNVIAEDQVMSAKVLRLVNSGFYGFPKKIGSLDRAVVILGQNEIKSLVLATSMLKVFPLSELNRIFDINKLWEHSISCAVASRILAEAAFVKNPEEVFAAGLLHDIGKLVLIMSSPEDFLNVINEIQDSGSSFIETEKKILGFNHIQIGKALAEKWDFPSETIDMIVYHHYPDLSGNISKEIAAIHLGNILSIALSLGTSGEKRVPMLNKNAWQTLDLKLSQLESIMVRVEKVSEESIAILKQ